MTTTSMAASHAANKRLNDAIFSASAACGAAAAKYGADKVTNATLGAMFDDEGNLASIPTMERVFRSLSKDDYFRYAPISGLPAYLKAVIDMTFADHRPEGYCAAIATAGGTGAIHHAIANYAELGDSVLTGDWFWGTYNVICNECGKKLETFELFENGTSFNYESFEAHFTALMAKQDSLLTIINSPAHNPTGFSLTIEDWENVIALLKKYAAQGKKLSLLVDIAYIDFAGEKNETRKFMDLFGNLPDNILVMFSFSMSKGYTVYGQRTGALIAVSASKEVIAEFEAINKYTSRATWSNINRGAMSMLVRIAEDAAVQKQFEEERTGFYHMIQNRAKVFMDEAEACGLKALPYKSGFFITVPTDQAAAVCEKLHDDLIFPVPLKKGIRVAACSVSAAKMHGIAEKMQRAMESLKQ